jgi:protein O-mannosyl-transferase
VIPACLVHVKSKETIISKKKNKHDSIPITSFDGTIWPAALAAAILTFLVFLPALGNEFVNFDDSQFIYENKYITQMDSEFFRWIFSNKETQWSPLRWISHAIDYKIWGLNPFGHHLTSIIIHSFNTFLVVVLIARLFESMKPGKAVITKDETEVFSKKALTAGIITGILFGIHPLRVESVVWVSERKDVLYTFFAILSVLCYLKYYKSVHTRSGMKFYWCSFCLFLLALMSKAMAVTVPFILLLLDVYPLERIRLRSDIRSWLSIAGEKFPFIAASVVVALINLQVHEEIRALVTLEKLPIMERIPLAFHAIPVYLSKIFRPFPLAPIYPLPENISFFRVEYIGSTLLGALITGLCVVLWRKEKKIWLSVWLYFIITLLPVLVMSVSRSFAPDRYSYMAYIGPFLIIGLGVAELKNNAIPWQFGSSSAKMLARILPFALIIVLSIFTVKQTGIWKNSLALWNHEVKVFPGAAEGYYSRAVTFFSMNNYDAAMSDINQAIILQKTFSDPYVVRSRINARVKNYQEAISDLSKAIEIKPTYSVAFSDRCGIYTRLKDFQQAIKDCNRAIELDPANPVAYNNRGFIFYALGDLERAVEDYSQAIAVNQMDPSFYHNRGIAYFEKKRINEALEDFRMAARLGDKQAEGFLRGYR